MSYLTSQSDLPTGERAKPAAGGSSPPVVIRGAKSQLTPSSRPKGTGPTICLDWLRLSGPNHALSRVRSTLTKYLGDLTPGKGRFIGLDLGEHIGTAGLFYSSDPDVKHLVVELPGSALGELEPSRILQLANELMWHGCRATRLDIALDFTNKPDLIELATTSCDLGELCHARRYTPVRTMSKRELVAHGLNIGARGKNGSGRYLRIYDKGCEQQTGEPGAWVRWEVELSDGVAASSLAEILVSKDPFSTARRIALGVCDFRIATGSRELSRRPRSRWFSDFLGELEGIRFVVARNKPTPTTWARWMQKCVAPKLATLGTATNVGIGGMFDLLAPDVKPDASHLGDGVVRGVLFTLDVPVNLAKHRISVGSARHD